MKRKPHWIVQSMIVIGIISLFIITVGEGALQSFLVPIDWPSFIKFDKSLYENPTSDPIEDVIAQNMEESFDRRDRWLEEVAPLTEEVSIQTIDDYNLQGHIYHQPDDQPSNKWAIILHGFQSVEGEAQELGPFFYDQGYNVLTYALRAHDPSEGYYIGMGYLDKDDLIAWTDFIIERDPESQIVYHGTSMGGATVLMAAGSEDLPHNVKVVIADCGYSSIDDILTFQMYKYARIPSYPILNFVSWIAKHRSGYSFDQGNVVEYVARSTVPIFFVHGTEDGLVPVEMVYDLYNAKQQGPKELMVIEGAGHIESKYAAVDAYYERIGDFIHRYIE